MDFSKTGEQVNDELVQCTFGCRIEQNPAVARIALSRGCVARRDDRVQDVCMHHLNRCDPLGDVEVIRWYGDLREGA